MNALDIGGSGKKAEIDPIAAGIGERGGNVSRHGGQAGRAGLVTHGFQTRADVRRFDGRADEQQLIEAVSRLGEADKFFFQAVARFFEIDGKEGVAGGVFINEREDFFDARDALAMKIAIEPTAGVELLDFGQRELGEWAAAIGGAVERGIVQADERALLRAANIELKADVQGQTCAEAGQCAFGAACIRPRWPTTSGRGGSAASIAAAKATIAKKTWTSRSAVAVIHRPSRCARGPTKLSLSALP